MINAYSWQIGSLENSAVSRRHFVQIGNIFPPAPLKFSIRATAIPAGHNDLFFEVEYTRVWQHESHEKHVILVCSQKDLVLLKLSVIEQLKLPCHFFVTLLCSSYFSLLWHQFPRKITLSKESHVLNCCQHYCRLQMQQMREYTSTNVKIHTDAANQTSKTNRMHSCAVI